jgi:hypothetical protein
MAGKVCNELIKEGQQPPEHKSRAWVQLCDFIAKKLGHSICGAKARHGWPCEKEPQENGKCHNHGGASRPPGADHPAFKTGRYSKALDGKQIGELYEQARNDPYLLSLNEEIALLTAKQQETLSRLGGGMGIEALSELGLMVRQLKEAVEKGQDGQVETILKAMGEVLEAGFEEHYIWKEYTERAEVVRKLVDTERKYQVDMRLMMPISRIGVLQQVWLDCMRRTVPQEYIAAFHHALADTRLGGTAALTPGRDVSNVGGRA